jgi:hypothetical protein
MTVHDELEKQRRAAEANAQGRQEWELEAERAAPTSLIRDIVSDAYRGISQSASLIPPRQRSENRPRPASGGPAGEVKPPPGIEHIDRLCDEADRRARAVAVQQKMELEWIEELLERRNPNKAKFEYDPFSRSRMGFSDDD